MLPHILHTWLCSYNVRILTFKRRVAILQEIVELAWVTFNEIPYAGVEDGRDGDKQLLVFSQILEASHNNCSGKKE